MKSEQDLYHARKGTSVPWLFILLSMGLLYLVPFSAVSHAADLTGQSRTYVQSRESMGGNKYLPIYEYLDLSVQDLGHQSISVHFGGWLGYDLQDDSFGQDKDEGRGIQYGYVSYRAKEHNAVVNLGRVMVFEGVAAERIDGVYARTDIKGGFGISVFGGTASIISEKPENNTIYGGRLSHQIAGLYTLGASYLKEEMNNAKFREEEGIDLWFRPINKVEIMGSSSFNVETIGWMEHAYYLMLGPFDKLRFNTEASWINYADYFAGTNTNVFKLTPGGPVDPNEKVNILGEEVFYSIDKNWAVSVDYKKYKYDIAGSANYYGAKATYAVSKSYSAGLSFHKMDGETNRLKYDEYRIYASKKVHKIDLALDLLDVKYKETINDVANAYSATIAAGYELTQKLKIGLDAEYSKNPDFDKDVRLFAKVIYSFDVASGSIKPAAGQEQQKAVSEPAAPVASPAPEPITPKAASEPAAPAAAPEQVAPSVPAGQAGVPAEAEQGKPKEGN